MKENINNYVVYTYDEDSLMACFDKMIPEEVFKFIAQREPLRAVFCDSSFTNSQDKINVFELFKLLAPHTEVKVI